MFARLALYTVLIGSAVAPSPSKGATWKPHGLSSTSCEDWLSKDVLHDTGRQYALGLWEGIVSQSPLSDNLTDLEIIRDVRVVCKETPALPLSAAVRVAYIRTHQTPR